MLSDVSEATLPGPQAERRRRVVEAAMQLGDVGGYEAVQMRDVAALAGVALGTVYRYFTSKDHLLAAALAEWTEEMETRLREVPARGTSPSERVVDLLARSNRAMGRRLGVVAAMVAAVTSSDPAVVGCQERISACMERMIKRAIGEPPPSDVDDISRVVGYVWYTTLIGWVNGWSNVGRVVDELEVAVRLLLKAPLAA